MLYGSARIHYTDTKLGIDTVQDLHVTAPFTDGAVPVDWENAEPAAERPEDLVREVPSGGASFAPLPPAALDPKKYAAWTRDFGQWVMRAERLTLFSAPAAKLTSRAGETERDFRLRLTQAARESRDAAVEKLRASYAGKIARLTQRVATAEEGVRARGGSGVAAEHADDGVVWRHGAWRAARTQGRQRLHARPRHDRRARRGPLGQGIAGRRARPGQARGRAGGVEGARTTRSNEEIAALTAVDAAGRGHRHHRGQAEARRRGRAPGGARLEARRLTWTALAAAPAMQEQTLDGHAGRPVAIDVCLPCQSFWFDAHESVQLSPGGTLALFRLIGEHAGRRPFSNADLAKCPRCQARLRLTQDMQRATRFSYLRCPNDHGRLTTFFDFLREKDFIRPLTPEQLQELRQNVQTVNCSNCGAPVDVMQGAACAHCRSPLVDARPEAGGGAGRAAPARRHARAPADRPGAAAGAAAGAPGGGSGVSERPRRGLVADDLVDAGHPGGGQLAQAERVGDRVRLL